MALSVKNIVKRYGDYYAVNGLSFEMPEPGVFALLGTNGAGKTTSIRVMLGMLAKESGEVTWKGRPLEVTTEKVGYLAEERGLYPKYNVYNQLKYFATLKGMKPSEIKTALDYWFERLNVNEYREKRPDQLSKGNQQKIQLIAALVSDPELLILDEPLSGLDPVNADLFKSVIREEIQKGKFVIMSAHQMALIEEFCQDIVILHKGNVLLNGNLNQIKRGYGRINLTVKADGDILPLAQECGLQLTNQTPSELHFHVGSEDQAQNLLFKVTQAGIPLVKFDLREPTLHEIFVEKVGGAADEN